jgi:hypothetical protein
VQDIKTGSSKWIKTKGTRYAKFRWQGGYGIFSVGYHPRDRAVVERYIANQAVHHRKKTFQHEYRTMLEKDNIPFDERYVWD